jgi:hypothetical protein
VPLPPEIANGLYINGLPNARIADPPKGNAHSQFTGVNVTREESLYTCTYDAGPGARRPGFQIAANDPNFLSRNFLFVSNIVSGVAVGIMPRPTVNSHAFSDNYGGCEFHILARAGGAAIAFLHVYRGGGVTAQYTIAPGSGWTLRQIVPSAPVVAAHGTTGSIVSYAYVAAGSNFAECCMLVLDNQGMVSSIHQYHSVNIA